MTIIVGTWLYIQYELFYKEDITNKIDLYSTCIYLYVLITLKYQFDKTLIELNSSMKKKENQYNILQSILILLVGN